MRDENRSAWKSVTIAFIVACCVQQLPAQTSETFGRSGNRLIAHAHGSVPLMFEANQGQIDSQVKFLSHGDGYSIFLTAGGMVLALPTSDATPPKKASVLEPNRVWAGHSALRQQENIGRRNRKSNILTIDLVGAASNPAIVGEEPLVTKVNYFIGRDPSKWRRNVPTYGTIRYRNVYPGIDLVYYGNNHRVEYDFELAPGADPAKVQFSVKGADALNVDSGGNLVLTKGGTRLLFQTPAIYQEINGRRVPVGGAYTVRDATHVGFAIEAHDNTKPTVIDPVLVYSTFLGGNGDDFSDGIAVDSLGDAYVVGITDSPDFPQATIGSYTPTQFRMFLTKMNPDGSALLFADYFGGTTGNDEAAAVALDSSGNAYVTGSAASSDFPVLHAYQSTLSGTQDAFLVKFSADGSSILYSTYLGGTNSQYSNSISVDLAGEAVIAGATQSTDFPMKNAYQSSIKVDQFGDWGVYGFLTKFDPNGTSLIYSSYLAGNILNTSTCSNCFPDSEILGVTTDGTGNAYVTGLTMTSNFPVTSGAFATAYPGDYLSDVGFVAKFSNSGAIAYSTYLGGLTSNFLNAVAVDSTGSAYVTGYENANDNFPIVNTSICDPSVANCNGAVVAKLDPTGSNLVYSTFLAATNEMAGQAIQVDASGDAFIVGSDIQFSLSNPIEGYAGGGDVVVAEIDPTASTQLMATFLGGQGWEAASGLALDSKGAVYVTGVTQSVDFPVTRSVFQTVWGGQTDAFIAKIDPLTNAPAVSMGPSSLTFSAQIVDTTSGPQTSTLRNVGSQALTISGITASGDFAETDDCGTTVAAASFCTLTVTFTPTASGSRIGAVTIVDDAQGSPHSLQLAGTGLAAASLSLSPSSLMFPPSSVGTTSAAQAITLTNGGNAPVIISAVQVTGDFVATDNNCGTVPAYGMCTVQVGFTPDSSGTLTGTVQFLDSVSGSPQVVTLSGSGTDFVTTPVSNNASVSPGGTADYKLDISPTGGAFSNTVTFACQGLPATTTCSVNPSSITPGAHSSAVTVAVTTSGPAASSGQSHAGFLAFWMAAPLAIFGVLVFGANQCKCRPYFATVAIFLLLSLVGCGTATRIAHSPSASNTIPAGTYQFNVIGSSGALHHVTTLTLVVQ